jgi:pimeloyl-ACP methyl ester carboxylesterase
VLNGRRLFLINRESAVTGQNQKAGNRRWRIGLLILGIALVIVTFVILIPWNIPAVSSHPHPVASYAEAMQYVTTLRAQEPPDMNPVCRLKLMTHDKKVERAIILVHGYTNCPEQFQALGQRFFDLGYNVLIAPLPHHGLADRLTDAHARLTAEELVAYADETVDIAQGLGEHVTMLGISAGGVTTAWAAQNRPDLDLAVIISPAFGYKQIPTLLTAAVMNLYLLLPDSIDWWDPALQGEAAPPHQYPRYSMHALFQILRLGFATRAQAQRVKPAAHKIVVVLNANDDSVNNMLTMKVIKSWQAHAADLTTYEFEAGLKLGHDLIDPAQPYQRIDIVYPRLIELSSR